MPSFKKLFPGKYLKAADLDGEDRPLVIERLVVEWIGQGADAEEKPVLFFEGEDQGLVLNVTNAATIAELHGEDTDDWPGRTIVLYPTRVQFGAKVVDAIRVRLTAEQPREQQEETVATVSDDGFSDSGGTPF